MNERLKVQIEADVKGLENSLRQADKLLKQHENNYKGVQKAISDNNQKAQQLEKSIGQLSNEYKKGNVSQSQYSKETDRLSAELREVNKETSDYQRELRRLDKEMDRAANATRNFDNATEQTGRATQNATQQVGKMGKAAKDQAVPAMMSLSQVMQDAPYGIRGVANNITQLTAQFGYLQRSAGGTGGALKAMASSMMGPAGILMGISIVTSLLVTYGDKLFKTTNATKELNDATKDLIGSAKSEITTLNALMSVAQNEEESKDNRLRAIKKINDLYGDYLPNLDLESVNTDKVTTAVNNLSVALIRQAKIRGVQDLISKKAGEVAQKEAEAIADAQDKLLKTQRKSDSIDPRLLPKGLTQEELDEKVGKFRDNLGATIITEATEGAAKEGKKELDKLTAYLEKLIGEDIQMKGVFTSTNEGGGGKTQKKGPMTLADYEALDLDALIDMNEAEQLLNEWKAIYAEAGLNIYDEMNMAEFNSLMAASQEQLITQSEGGFAEWLKQWEKTAKEQGKFTKEMEAAVQGMIGGIISSLIDGKFELKDFVKSAASTLLSVLLTSSTGPLGALFGGLFSGGGVVNAGKFATGGVIGGNRTTGDNIIARVNSGEMILNKAQQGNLFKMINNPSETGQSGPLEIVGHSRVSGEDLNIIFERYLRSSGRV